MEIARTGDGQDRPDPSLGRPQGAISSVRAFPPGDLPAGSGVLNPVQPEERFVAHSKSIALPAGGLRGLGRSRPSPVLPVLPVLPRAPRVPSRFPEYPVPAAPPTFENAWSDSGLARIKTSVTGL
jgi:hypothetical protein